MNRSCILEKNIKEKLIINRVVGDAMFILFPVSKYQTQKIQTKVKQFALASKFSSSNSMIIYDSQRAQTRISLTPFHINIYPLYFYTFLMYNNKLFFESNPQISSNRA